jgi:thiol-disulfide isomerase/thioredoxin
MHFSAKFLPLFCIAISHFPLADSGMGNASTIRLLGRPDSLKVGDAAPMFVMRDIFSGDPVYLRDYTGKTLREDSKNKERHAIVLSFWATWCQPCKKEIPILAKMAEDFKGKPVKIFLIDALEGSGNPPASEDSVKSVIRSRKYTLPCLVDASGRFADKYFVRYLPNIVVIDKYGIVRKVNRGYHENFEIELAKLLNELIKE